MIITKASIWYGTRTSLLLLYPCTLAAHTCKPFPVITMRLQTDWRCKFKVLHVRHKTTAFSCVLLLESSTPRPSHTLSCWAESNVTSIQPYSAEQTVASNIKQRKKGKHHRVYYKTPTCPSRCLLPILILRKVKCPTRVPEDFGTLSKPLLQ